MWQVQDEIESTDQHELLNDDNILIRCSGNITIFGLCNKYNTSYPSQLTAKVAPEEFAETINKINKELRKNIDFTWKALILGCLCCCCSCGMTMIPPLILNNKAKRQMKKILDWENTRVYNKIGLNWILRRLPCERSPMLEYVLILEKVRQDQILAVD